MSNLIAPHKGDELKLVRIGQKPLAVIEKVKDHLQYINASEYCSVTNLPFKYRNGDEGPEVVIAQDQQTLDKYLELIEGTSAIDTPEYHRAMGELFGYTEEQIQAFIDSELDCDCSKCSPN